MVDQPSRFARSGSKLAKWSDRSVRRLRRFIFEGFEHAVPNDKNAAVVGIQGGFVTSVVNPVVGRRDEEELENTHPVDQAGVHPELIKKINELGPQQSSPV